MLNLEARKPELSIIVPIYNVEDYLEDCVQSILNQSYQDYEILLIDDGSTDNSPRICDSFTDERIRVFHKENGGLSSARNVGLENANGEFISFLDSDDQYGDKETISKNIQIMKSNPEIDFLQYPMIVFFNGLIQKQYAPKERYLYNSDIFKEWYRYFDTLIYNVGNKIYRRSSLCGINFHEGKTAEDILFHFELIKNIHCSYISEHGSFLYYLRNGSITHKPIGSNQWKKFKMDELDALTIIYLEATKRPELKIHRISFLFRLMYQYFFLKRICPDTDYSLYRKRLYSHRITIYETLCYSISPEATKRDIIHAWTFCLLGSWYDTFYFWLSKKNKKHYKII